MLRELLPTRQIPGDPRRRWFASTRCDLIVWLRDDESVLGFQLCYDKDEHEHALTWTSGGGFVHLRVDSGHNFPGTHKGTPLLLADGIFDAARILDLFRAESEALPPEYVALVIEKLQEFARSAHV